MRNFVQPGDTWTVIAPYAVTSGQGVQVGTAFAVAKAPAAAGSMVESMTHGVHDLAKAAGQAWTQGQKLYWDNTARNVTNVPGSNIVAGYAWQAQASADTTGRVKVTDQV